MNAETALTNFTASKRKIDSLFELKKITLKDFDDLNQMEREYLKETTNQKLAQLKGTERDNFLDKTDLIITPATKSDVWEYNMAHLPEAERLTKDVDHFDMRYVALALQTGGLLWTGDKKLTTQLKTI